MLIKPMLIKPITSMSLTKLLVMNRNELRIVQKFTKDLLCLIIKLLIIKNQVLTPVKTTRIKLDEHFTNNHKISFTNTIVK